MFRNAVVASPRLPGAVILATTGLIAASGFAMAQQNSAITVVAPHRVSHKAVGMTYSGVPIEQISLSHQVGYSDLDLTKPYGVSTLKQRIADTAKAGCQELDTLYPDGIDVALPLNKDCVQTAVDSATPQVEAALLAAKK